MLAEAGIFELRWGTPDPASPVRSNSDPISSPIPDPVWLPAAARMPTSPAVLPSVVLHAWTPPLPLGAHPPASFCASAHLAFCSCRGSSTPFSRLCSKSASCIRTLQTPLWGILSSFILLISLMPFKASAITSVELGRLSSTHRVSA